jgi:hypothetical protein
MRTLIYDTPSVDAIHLEGIIESEAITQDTPVPFRVPIIRVDGVIDMDATVALVHEMEDQIDLDIAEGLIVGRVPV